MHCGKIDGRMAEMTPRISAKAASRPFAAAPRKRRNAAQRGNSPNEFYARFAGIAGSIRFDARELHHLGPLLGFVGDQSAEIGGGGWKGGGGPARQHRRQP